MRTRLIIAVTCVLLAAGLVAATTASAWEDSLTLKAESHDGVVDLSWDGISDNQYVKLIRSDEDFVTDPFFGDPDPSDATTLSETPATVPDDGEEVIDDETDLPGTRILYVGNDTGYVDTDIEEAGIYYYSIFAIDRETGDFVGLKSFATAVTENDDPGDLDEVEPGEDVPAPASLARPTCPSTVRAGRGFTAKAKVVSAGSAGSTARYLVYKKAKSGWVKVRSGSASATDKALSAKLKGLKRGSYKLVFQSKLGRNTSLSRPRYFKVK
jgi:hypothetical protein